MVDILDFLKTNFNAESTNLGTIMGGERSKAFYFSVQSKMYVFRKNKHNIGFLKDKFAEENFGKILPIPRMVKMGVFKDGFYAISEYCNGMTLSNKNLEFSNELIENIFQTLDKIHTINKFDGGFGVTGLNGNAPYKSWSDWVLKDNTLVTKDDGSFYSWKEIKKINFVDNTIIEKIFAEIKTLLPFIPNVSTLIHGDFATGNVIVDRKQVLGVIDWNEFGYGDFLYDLAWLDFWTPKIDFVQAYWVRSKNRGVIIPNYFERIRCHKLFIGLTALGLYAAINLQNTYNKTLKKMNQIPSVV